MNKDIFQRKRLGIILRILITAIVILVIYIVVRDLVSNVSSITYLAKSAGIYGPIVLVLLIALGIIFTPIPNIVLIIAAGYIYGTWQGAIYSYLGHMLAACGTFAIVRIFNIEKESRRYRKYKNLIEKNKKILYLLFAAPIIPISILSIVSSSSKMKWKEFLKIINISFIPVILFFSYFGERISQRNLVEIGIFALVVIVGIFIVFGIMKRGNKKMQAKDKNKRPFFHKT